MVSVNKSFTESFRSLHGSSRLQHRAMFVNKSFTESFRSLHGSSRLQHRVVFVNKSFTNLAGLYTALVAFSMCGKFFIAATFAVIYVYSAELFPTVVRQVGVGSSSMCARVSGIIQPQFGRLVSSSGIPSCFAVLCPFNCQ